MGGEEPPVIILGRGVGNELDGVYGIGENSGAHHAEAKARQGKADS